MRRTSSVGYEAIGRIVVKQGIPGTAKLIAVYLRSRYSRELRIAAALGVAAVVGVAYVAATRDAPEG
ncbi:MAG: hypothetical protein U0R52_09795 [Solirubrobacterales bacterium]